MGNYADTHVSGSRGPLLFNATLTPNSSLGFRKLQVLIGALCIVFCFGAGIFFTLGAWPVSGFFGLELAILLLALRTCHRDTLLRETVSLHSNRLTVERVAADGRTTTWHFQPYWLQINLHQTTRDNVQLVLSSGTQSLQLGSFLSPAEQGSLAEALETALGRS